VFYLILAAAALMFGLYNVFIKVASDHINPVLGAVVLQFMAAFLGLGLLVYLRASGEAVLKASPRGIGLAVLAGVAIGLVEILSFFVYGRGIPVAVGNPLIIGGSLIVTTGVGVLLLRESMNPVQLAATLLIIAGVALLAWGATR
jgi:transporter family protein